MIVVDELVPRGWRYGPNCHMATDDLSPAGLSVLHALATKIGLRRSYFQPSSYPHYDLNASKRALAIEYGATPVTCQELALLIRRVRQEGKASA